MAKSIETVAQEVRQGWEDAAGDIAMNCEYDFGSDEAQEKYDEIMAETGDRYLAIDCAADDVFDDEDAIVDYVGDRIHDAVNQVSPELSYSNPKWDEIFCKIADETKKQGYGSWCRAMDRLIARHQRHKEVLHE